MPEEKQSYEKKLSLYPLTFEEALKKAVNVPAPKEKKHKSATKRRKPAENMKTNGEE